MRKKGFMAMVGIVVMMVMVAVLAVGSQTKANACSFFKKENVNIYTGNENADGFNVSVVKTKVTPKKLIKALKKQGAVANGVKVRTFTDNDTSLVLNLSQAFADDVSSSGTAGEFIKVGCVVNTFLDAYDASEILIKVEGATLETGHAIYDEPLSMMKGMEAETPDEEPEVEPEQPEVEEEIEVEDKSVDINIYVGNENADGFEVKIVQIEELTAENVMAALIKEGAIAEGVTVNSFRDIGANLVLDLSSEFLADVSSSGTAGEYIKIGCVVNTFLEAFNSPEILITVNGDPWETGHAMYDNTLTKFQ